MSTATYALDTTWRTLLADMGMQPADVLRRAGLPDDLFAQPTARLPAEVYHRLWCSIEAEHSGTEPALPLPLRVCEAVRSESFSPVLFAALCSPDLRVAAQRVAQYKALIGPIRLDVRESAGLLTLEFAWHGDAPQPPPSLALMELVFCVTLARIGTRASVWPVEVTSPHPPEQMAPYEAVLGIRIRHGSGHRVSFRVEDAARPFLTSNPSLWSAFEPELRKRLSDLEAGTPTASRARAALLEGLPSGRLGIDDVARRLAMSKRTLQRRIEAEGTTFQRLLNDTRRDLARHYLANTALTHAEISFLLGFDETNSFYRAVKSWTGATPDALRRRDLPAD